ncbi:MAG: hypothetical protein ACQETB_08870 [Halobacteriota archaeon]
MQRRAVAVYVALFLLVSVASYALIATAEAPTISLENADHELSEGDSFDIDGVTYAVESVGTETDDEETQYAGTIEWTESDVEQSEIWNNESTIEYRDGEWTVLVDSGEEPTGFTLQEVVDRTAILESDPDARNETVEADDDTESVIVTDETGQEVLVPADEYFPAPQTEQYTEGDTVEYAETTVTIDAVDSGSVTVVWSSDETRSADLAQGEVVTLGGNEYLAYFSTADTVLLTQDISEYEAQVSSIETYEDRVSGFWYVIVASLVIATLLVLLGMLPSRY